MSLLLKSPSLLSDSDRHLARAFIAFMKNASTVQTNNNKNTAFTSVFIGTLVVRYIRICTTIRQQRINFAKMYMWNAVRNINMLGGIRSREKYHPIFYLITHTHTNTNQHMPWVTVKCTISQNQLKRRVIVVHRNMQNIERVERNKKRNAIKL